jgi:hypothetical protein
MFPRSTQVDLPISDATLPGLRGLDLRRKLVKNGFPGNGS